MFLFNKLTDLFGEDFQAVDVEINKLIENRNVKVLSCVYDDGLDMYTIETNRKIKSKILSNVILHAVKDGNGTWLIKKEV